MSLIVRMLLGGKVGPDWHAPMLSIVQIDISASRPVRRPKARALPAEGSSHEKSRR
jgi:hypothetical protein